MRVAGDQRFAVWKKHSCNIFKHVVTVVYQILLETNCVDVFFIVKLHDRGSATFFAKTVNGFRYGSKYTSDHKLIVLSITIQVFVKIQMIREAVVQRCSIKKVFLEILQNSQESTCRPATLF